MFKMIQGKGSSASALLLTVGIMAAAYVGCFGIMELLRVSSQKRRSKLDDIDEESEG